MSHPLDCECIYCTHNHDDRCGCPTCAYIRRVYGEQRHPAPAKNRGSTDIEWEAECIEFGCHNEEVDG